MMNVYNLRVIPPISDYVKGLTAIRERMNDTQRRLLAEQYQAPERTVTSPQLAKLAGVRGGHSVVNLQYGRLGHIFCDALGFTPNVRPDGTYRWWAVWSVGYDTRTQGFLWEMRPEVVEALELLGWVSTDDTESSEKVRLPDSSVEATEGYQSSSHDLSDTEREAVVQSRIGQGRFRTLLIQYWEGGAVTNCQVIETLKASHIKPWRDADNAERLDIYNGLLLVPNLDSAFDRGLISFEDDGTIIISNLLNNEDRTTLGIHSGMRMRKIAEEHLKYLAYHRQVIFR
jgi:hypothetical protein